MHVTTIDHYRPQNGELLTWALDPSDCSSTTSAVPPSFNQNVHLATARSASGDSTWLAAAFTVNGPIDRVALGRAYQSLISRHGTLHSSFRAKSDGSFDRQLFDPGSIRLLPAPGIRCDDESALQQTIWERLNTACHPFGFPAYLLAAIDRPAESTVLCGFDHAHVDAYSMSIIVDDLHELYCGFRDIPGFSADTLAMSGNFLDYCAAEAEAAVVRPSDPRMLSWLRFFDDRDGTPPCFPLDLGLAPGERAPQGVDVRPLLNATATASFADFCRTHSSSTYGGVLAAMAEAVRRCGGGPELAMLFPMHTRRSAPWQSAVGWFTTNAPLSVVSTGDMRSTIRRAGPALRRAMRLGEVPVPQVIAALGGLNQIRRDIFMVSYIDYRSLPGAQRHHEIDAHHISNVSSADDAQFWISRTDDGIAIRSRYPDTALGRRMIRRFLDETARIIEDQLDPVAESRPRSVTVCGPVASADTPADTAAS